MARFSNPLAFSRGPVTIITLIVYIAIIAVLIVIQTGVPTPPSPTDALREYNINSTEAWNDLQLLSAEYHPFNSRRNDFTRDWLLGRIHEILKSNDVPPTAAYVFDDRVSNLTFSSAGAPTAVYMEGLNIVVYIRGELDDKNEWWNTSDGRPSKQNGVLVNAHIDSVSTGFGATDDGVGVVTILQLLRYYTGKGRSPKNGLVLLLNNGEEDFLNGATVFSQHPLSRLPSSFLNLEGAGAGGRAALFRSTDKEVTEAYARSPYPFGTVVSGDAFNRGIVRSQTDYIVFNGRMGMRGLDVAFIEPRARYHTAEDDSRHTNMASLWHMLSSSLATTKALTNSVPRIDVEGDQPHASVWFDMFGRTLALMETHTYFALSVTLLVVGPILLLLTLGLLYRADKLYLFSGSRKIHTIGDEETVPINGWRGYFRFPLILVASCAAPVALAYLIFKVNPYIAHGSEWAVWALMVSSFVFVAWFFCRAIDFLRPSALTRAYGFSWLVVIWWVFLVLAVIFEEQLHLAGGYFALFYFACVLAATFLSYLELFSLPKKSKYCAQQLGDVFPAPRSRSASRPVSRSTREEPDIAEENEDGDDDENEPTESSSLLRNRGGSAFKNYSQHTDIDRISQKSRIDEKIPHPHNEQEWSKPMWTWLWVLQFLALAPINIVILGQLALYLVAALHQTGADGSSMFTVYLAMAVMTIFIFSPLVPLLHRFSWHIPFFLLLVLIATVVYNLLAFPFSSQNKLKLFFQQEIDLNTGLNNVSLTGAPGYVQEAISWIPSAAGQEIKCDKPMGTERQKCVWTGTAPNVANLNVLQTSKHSFKTWVNYNTSLHFDKDGSRTARFVLYGKNTRSCRLKFDTPIDNFRVVGSAPEDERFPHSGLNTQEIRLWHREWDRAWTVDVKLPPPEDHEDKMDTSLSGRVSCIWSDVNQHGVVPAFDEVTHFVPTWVAITKLADGLVEGYKRFEI